jgi:hypothetical protein
LISITEGVQIGETAETVGGSGVIRLPLFLPPQPVIEGRNKKIPTSAYRGRFFEYFLMANNDPCTG